MWADEAWAVLELEPCSDAKAVKRAYAQKLKAIDPDQDITGFERLRAALMSAQADANWRASPEYAEHQPSQSESWAGELDEEWDENWEEEYYPADNSGYWQSSVTPHMAFAANQARMDAAKPDFSSFSGGNGQAAGEDLQPGGPDPFRELVAALSDDDSAWNNENTLKHSLQMIFDDPRMQNVDFARESENWLAILLGQTRPKSDPLIVMAYTHFGWQNRLDGLDEYDPEFYLAQTGYDIIVEQALQNPSHEWHEAYLRLSMENPPAPSYKDRMQLAGQMEPLISSLTHHNPALLHKFDQEHLDKWRGVGYSDEKSGTRYSGDFSPYSIAWVVGIIIWIAFKAWSNSN